jgi:hypothetical protein
MLVLIQRSSANMSEPILKEITRAFLDAVKKEQIIKDNAQLEKFSTLFDEHTIPSVEQLKDALFSEELS